MLVAFVQFINIASLPTNREGSLDVSNVRSVLPSRVSSESVTASILPQEKGQPDNEVEALKKTAETNIGYVRVQGGKNLASHSLEEKSLCS